MEGKGISYGSKMVWHDAMHFKGKMMETIPQANEDKLKALGIDYFSGTARFSGPGEVTVHHDTLKAEHILIGTGSTPRPLELPGGNLAIDSEAFLNLETLPRKFVFVGGGYIAYELAHVVKHAGSEAIILEATSRTLHAFDEELVAKLNQAGLETGIEVRINSKVTEIKQEENHLAVIIETNKGKETVTGEVVVNTTGRVPAIGELNLAAGRVAVKEGGIEVNQYLQSISNPAVYACGDVLPGSRQLTPVAEMESRVIAGNLLKGNQATPDYSVIPSVVFALPMLAAVGLKPGDPARDSEKTAVISMDASRRHETRRVGYRDAFYKIIVEPSSGRLLGAHLLGHNVYEVINLMALAIRQKLTITQLSEMVWSFPSLTYDALFSLNQQWEKQQATPQQVSLQGGGL
jgi:glutathione reductase (NADPH)